MFNSNQEGSINKHLSQNSTNNSQKLAGVNYNQQLYQHPTTYQNNNNKNQDQAINQQYANYNNYNNQNYENNKQQQQHQQQH